MALKDESGGKPWYEWEPELVARKPAALAQWREKLADEHSLSPVRPVCLRHPDASPARLLRGERQIKLIGDIPIFVAHDSADVWARPDLFFLDGRAGRPSRPGFLPTSSATTGQLWGNPLYRWEAHEKEGFAWWIDRLSALLSWVDLIRIDHFRGFEAYWEVPGKARTAATGRWVQSPGAAFFEALQQRVRRAAPDRRGPGRDHPEVEALRDGSAFPGCASSSSASAPAPSEEKHLPHRFVPHCVVYTGTHDNDTSLGWLTSTHVQTTQSLAEIEAERAYALRYAGDRRQASSTGT